MPYHKSIRLASLNCGGSCPFIHVLSLPYGNSLEKVNVILPVKQKIKVLWKAISNVTNLVKFRKSKKKNHGERTKKGKPCGDISSVRLTLVWLEVV